MSLIHSQVLVDENAKLLNQSYHKDKTEPKFIEQSNDILTSSSDQAVANLFKLKLEKIKVASKEHLPDEQNDIATTPELRLTQGVDQSEGKLKFGFSDLQPVSQELSEESHSITPNITTSLPTPRSRVPNAESSPSVLSLSVSSSTKSTPIQISEASSNHKEPTPIQRISFSRQLKSTDVSETHQPSSPSLSTQKILSRLNQKGLKPSNLSTPKSQFFCSPNPKAVNIRQGSGELEIAHRPPSLSRSNSIPLHLLKIAQVLKPRPKQHQNLQAKENAPQINQHDLEMTKVDEYSDVVSAKHQEGDVSSNPSHSQVKLDLIADKLSANKSDKLFPLK